jgi:phage portal protein BeeE
LNLLQRGLVRMLGLKGSVPATDVSALDSRVTGVGWTTIQEPFTGAWQRNMECDAPQDLLGFSAVYACISLIADDIAKLDLCLKAETEDGVLIEAPAQSPFWRVLRKPNTYQTPIQ